MALALAASRDGVGGFESEWPELLPALVSTVARNGAVSTDENNDPSFSSDESSTIALSGAIRGLSLLVDELDDAAALEATPHVLPAALRVVLSPLGGAAAARLGLRTRALAVGRALLGALAHAAAGAGAGAGGQGAAQPSSSLAARAAADEALSSWLPAVAALLSSEEGAAAAERALTAAALP